MIFNRTPNARVRKSKFNLSHEKKMTAKMGTLVPFLCQEILPGDSFRVNTEIMLRLQPMLAPIMHRIKIKTDFFFVPNRLVWDNWGKFITGGEKGTDNPVHPFFELGDGEKQWLASGSLADYMGLPTVEQDTTLSTNVKFNALPFRAYQLIYNEYYRDQNLIDTIEISKTDGADPKVGDTLQLRKRAWEKDYFTSALPKPQKGSEVLLPNDIVYKTPATAQNAAGTPAVGDIAAGANGNIQVAGADVNLDVIESLGITINDLRTSVRLQEWLERNARAGSRYIEAILSHFGVLSSDARLQRPEYLGGGVNPVVISEVLSTFQVDTPEADTSYPQGYMAGHGIATGPVSGFKRKFEEHGFILGLMTVLPKTAYSQGLPKMYSRFDKFDYAWPSFAQLGEQPVTNKEIYFRPDGVGNDATFGWQSRYAEYKYQPSTIHGNMRNNLAFWHQGRIFSAAPSLNQTFIEPDENTLKRPFAIQDADQDDCIIQLYNRIDAVRPLPYFNIPQL